MGHPPPLPLCPDWPLHPERSFPWDPKFFLRVGSRATSCGRLLFIFPCLLFVCGVFRCFCVCLHPCVRFPGPNGNSLRTLRVSLPPVPCTQSRPDKSLLCRMAWCRRVCGLNDWKDMPKEAPLWNSANMDRGLWARATGSVLSPELHKVVIGDLGKALGDLLLVFLDDTDLGGARSF